MPSDPASEARRRLILAVDTSDIGEARALIAELSDLVGVFKVGLELIGHTGPEFLSELAGKGVRVFFDGKFLDIPNTVAGATRACAGRGVFMFNVHATGGLTMMESARKAADEAAAQAGREKPLVLAVTVLTSIGEKTLADELGVSRPLPEQVVHLALIARQAGLDGVVCSANEVQSLRQAVGPDFLLVTPGVRPSWSSADDQVRIVTPAQAVSMGADYIVVGRPITAASDRRAACRRGLDEMAAALPERA